LSESRVWKRWEHMPRVSMPLVTNGPSAEQAWQPVVIRDPHGRIASGVTVSPGRISGLVALVVLRVDLVETHVFVGRKGMRERAQGGETQNLRH